MTRQDDLRAMVAVATQEPWVWSGGTGVQRPGGRWVHVETTVPHKQAVANARLIAQAPTLATDLAAALDRIAELEAAPFPDRTGFYGLIGDAVREAEKAMRKFPQPNYVISKVAEEAGEVVKAAIHCAEGRETPENVRGEMKQLIAMLYRLWVEGDGVHGLPPARAVLTPAPTGQEGA